MPAIDVETLLLVDEVTDPRVRPGGGWVSAVVVDGTSTGARSRLVMWRPGVAEPVVLLSDPAPVGGRGLSGGSHIWSPDGSHVHVVARGEGIVTVGLHDDVPVSTTRTAFDPSRSWSTPSLDASGRILHAVADWREMWRADLGGGEPELVASVDDGFLLDCDAPGGPRAHAWHKPEMPWTQSRIHPHATTPGVAVQQPRSTSDGRTRGHVSDESGRMNVVIEADRVSVERTVIVDDCEHAGPVWGPGQRTWCPSPEGTRIAYTRNEDGFGSLWILDRRTGERSPVARAVHGCLSWEGEMLAALRSGARTPVQLVAYDTSTPDFARTIVAAPLSVEWASHDAELIEPECRRARAADGTTVPFRLHRPRASHGGLIVWVHGGPTDQWQVTFRPRLAWWNSRGWTIAVVDHRGTTGHGRTFALDLEGGWGDVDARDTVAVLDELRSDGYPSSRTVLAGSSAGGLTVLNAASLSPSSMAGVVASYPVVDLAELMRADDPFETHYVPRLVGARSPDDELVAERSAHRRADRLATVPLLVFHGDEDASVPLVHSLRLRDAVVAAGGDIRLEVMEGEGHGFRDPANVAREFAVTEDFVTRVTGGA